MSCRRPFTKHIRALGNGLHLKATTRCSAGASTNSTRRSSSTMQPWSTGAGWDARDGPALRDSLRAIRAGSRWPSPAPTLATPCLRRRCRCPHRGVRVRAQRQLDGASSGSSGSNGSDANRRQHPRPQRGRFVERAVRTSPRSAIASTRSTTLDRPHWEILCGLARELDHLDVRRSRNAASAHRLLAPYAGSDTWVLGVDGDELYDPAGLARFRADLLEGAHVDVFRVKAHVLNCDELDVDRGRASGWLAPPSRPVTKLFNFAVLQSWTESHRPAAGRAAVFSRGSTGSRGATSPNRRPGRRIRWLLHCASCRARAWTLARRARISTSRASSTADRSGS